MSANASLPKSAKGTKERFCVKVANKQVENNQVWELPTIVIPRKDPKDPAVLKMLCRSKFTMRSEFAIAQGFAMATPPCADPQFSWVLQALSPQERGSQRTKFGGRSKKHYGVVAHYPVAFLVRLGPLGNALQSQCVRAQALFGITVLKIAFFLRKSLRSSTCEWSSLAVCDLRSLVHYYRAQNGYTHTFLLFGN